MRKATQCQATTLLRVREEEEAGQSSLSSSVDSRENADVENSTGGVSCLERYQQVARLIYITRFTFMAFPIPPKTPGGHYTSGDSGDFRRGAWLIRWDGLCHNPSARTQNEIRPTGSVRRDFAKANELNKVHKSTARLRTSYVVEAHQHYGSDPSVTRKDCDVLRGLAG